MQPPDRRAVQLSYVDHLAAISVLSAQKFSRKLCVIVASTLKFSDQESKHSFPPKLKLEPPRQQSQISCYMDSLRLAHTTYYSCLLFPRLTVPKPNVSAVCGALWGL